MGFGEGTRAVRKRKVIYDDYTGGFYTESTVERVQRQCDYRARLAEVVNKSEEARYRLAARQVEAERHVFLTKTGRTSHKYADVLQDHRAHLNVLERLAKDRGNSDDIYGRYPPNSLRPDLGELVDKELNEFSPVVKRKREATRLFLNRNPLGVMDRTKTTSDLYADLKSLKSRVSSPEKTAVSARLEERLPAKLILPAITVKMAKTGDKPRVSDSDSVSQGQVQSKHTAGILPSVFVTQSLSLT